MAGKVFFCYARENGTFALRLAENLKKRGIAIWLDQWDIPPEADWDKTIDRSLAECAHLLIILSPASVESREVRGELRTALDLGKPVLPVLHQPCEIPRQLRIVQFVDFTGRDADDEEALQQLVLACGANAELPAPIQKTRGSNIRKPPRVLALGPLRIRSTSLIAILAAIVLAASLWFGLRSMTEDRRRMNYASLSPNGSYLAAATGQGFGIGKVHIWDIASGRQLHKFETKGPFWMIVWSPDGNALALGDHEGKITICEADTWRVLHELTGARGPAQVIAWSPNSAAIASGDSNGTVWVWRVSDGKKLFYRSHHSKNIAALAWSPNGERIATASWDQSVGIIDARNGNLLNRLQGHSSFVNTVAWSPDGKWIASGSSESPYLIVWDDQGRSRTLEGPQKSVERVAWSSGPYLASAGKDDSVQFWDTRTFNNIGRLNLGGEYNSGDSLAWSPDGTRLAAGDSSTVWVLNPMGEVQQKLAGYAAETYSTIEIGGWSADGKRLASYRTGDGARVWDTLTGNVVGNFRIGFIAALSD